MPESERSSDDDSQWCEICETGGHDILNCTSMFGSKKVEQQTPTEAPTEQPPAENPTDDHANANQAASDSKSDASSQQKTGRDVVLEGLKNIGGLGSSMAPAAGKSSGIIDESKWCALCERDGHESIDCPFDD